MNKGPTDTQMLTTILEEVKALRSEVSLFLPGELLSDYAHPRRIRGSLRKALEKFPRLPDGNNRNSGV